MRGRDERNFAFSRSSSLASGPPPASEALWLLDEVLKTLLPETGMAPAASRLVALYETLQACACVLRVTYG